MVAVKRAPTRPALRLVDPREPPPEDRQPLSPGAALFADPEFRGWHLRVTKGGDFTDRPKALNSPRVKTLLTGTSATSAGAMTVADTSLGVVPALRRPLTLRDLVTVIDTSSDTIEAVVQGAETNNAAPVAEATATATGGTKPESSLGTFTRDVVMVRTIAHWIPVSRRGLADAPQVRGIIDAFLLDGLNQEVEDQMLTGDGTGENFTGLVNIAGTQPQAWDTDLLHTTRKARRKVRTVGRDTPTAWLLNPADCDRLELLQDNNGGYYFGGPGRLEPLRLWGLPVVEHESVTEGTGWVGNFRRLVLYDREQATLQVSDSHADFFTRNLVAILAELRRGFGCLRPASLVQVDLTA